MKVEVCFISAILAAVSAIKRPPGIILEPAKNVYFKAGETVKLPCEAEGDPTPRYSWTRNEVSFEPAGNEARIVQLPNSGTLVFNSPEDKDEGLYQCIASNEYGASVTVKVNLREAKLDPFPATDPNAPLNKKEVSLGESLVLDCVPPDSVPPPDVTWVIQRGLEGMQVVNYDERVTMDREFRLRFTNVIKSDEQDNYPYRCMVMNTYNMRLSVLGPSYYIITTGESNYHDTKLMWSDQDDRSGLKGETLSIKCIFSGNPTPDVHWERTDGQPLPDRAKTKSFGQELEIEDLQFEDAGNYECYASNTVSQNRIIKPFAISVMSAPYFTEEPKDIELLPGGDAEFKCAATGVPEPSVNWLINGKQLQDAITNDKRLQDPKKFNAGKVGSLFFRNVTGLDSMVIQCNASNVHGYVFADVYLNVQEEEPSIIDPPEPLKVTAEGVKVELTCETTGKPDPIITWFKDGQQISGGRYFILPSGSLEIQRVVLADAGHFRCNARNRFNQTSAEGKLVVRRKTRIEKMPKDLEVYAGNDAKFTCSGTTDPEEVNNLEIQWLKDGKRITTTDDRMTTNIQDSSLTISGTITRDTGTYTCIATNGLDNATQAAVLTVKDRPQAPTRVKHEYCDKNATIHWMPGSYNNAPIQYYVLQYNTSFNPDQWNFGLKVSGDLVTVNMTLSPWVNYNFRIIAYNKIGASNPSYPSPEVCSTKARRPAFHPKNLRTIGFQRSKLYIDWTPVPQLYQNGPGFMYSLEVLRIGEQSESSKETYNLQWYEHFIELVAPEIYAPYEISIMSKNNEGPAEGDPTKIIGYSYESTPDSSMTPTAVVVEETGDTFVILTWEFNKAEIGKRNTRIRGEFKGFKVLFWEFGRRPLTAREMQLAPEDLENLAGNKYRARINEMLPYTDMEAQISVRNNFYMGMPSETVRYRTKPGLPGVVDYFRELNIGDTHVNLEWAAPVENRGNLIGYDISYRTVRGLDLGVMQDREPQINDRFTTNTYLSGLSPNTKYRIYIYARTAAGRGEAYFIEIVTAKPGIPLTPRFTIENVGRTYINVSWWIDARAASGTVVYVEYRKLDGPEWLRTTDEVVNTWKNVSNLEPGTEYELRIKATNGKISVASGIDEVTTDGIAKAYDLIGNIGWFCGMLLSVLFIIGMIIFMFLCYRRGFRFNALSISGGGSGRTNAEPYSGSYDNTQRVAADSRFGPEPKGYSNDYYDDRDYNNYNDDGGFNRPPSYSSDMDREKRRSAEYEDFDQRPQDYDYDRYGNAPTAPQAGYDDGYRDDYRDDYRDGYKGDNQGDYQGDYRDDYRDDYDDQYDQYDDRRRNDEGDIRYSGERNARLDSSTEKPHSSTFV